LVGKTVRCVDLVEATLAEPREDLKEDCNAVEGGFMNTLDLLGRRVRYNGETGVVVSHCEPGSSRHDGLAAQRGRSVTIRIEGKLAAHFVEVSETDLERIEVLD
jgi:hypothetical protein